MEIKTMSADELIERRATIATELDAPEADLDNLTRDFPHTSWRSQIQHAKKIGLGEDSYELVNIG